MDSVSAGKVEIGATDLVPGSLGFPLSGVSGSVIGGSAHTVSSSHAQDLKEEIGASAEKTRRERIEDEFNSIGRLESSAEDYMTLHTREAYQLFVGRAGTQKRIVGATTAAAGLKNVWMLSGNDNPVADWVLVGATQSLNDLEVYIDEWTAKLTDRLAKAKEIGLELSVMSSATPLRLSLGYRSPYGYLISMVLVKLDYLVRLLRSLNGKASMSDDKMNEIRLEVTHRFRSLANQVTNSARSLIDDRMLALSRADWLSDDEQAQKRVAFVNQAFGPIPVEIFNGSLAPTFGRRRVRLSADELRLLNDTAIEAERRALLLQASAQTSESVVG